MKACARLCSAVLLALLFIPSASRAGGEPNPAADCERTAATQYAMNQCAVRERTEADQALDKMYQKLMAKISPEGQTKLRAAKEAWTVYRDRQCAFNVFGSDGGSVHPMVLSLCHADMARRQTAALLEQLNCEEGNLSCGSQ